MKFTDAQKMIFIAMFFLGAFVMYLITQRHVLNFSKAHWRFQSIDTMKYSRDLARSEKNNPKYVSEIDIQIAAIAATGATHVAIGTPYDDEFIPVLKIWTRSAREHNLKVWFRGNWSGWEKWFDFEGMDEQTHTEKTRQFILNNAGLFEDGDVFTSCPECENGSHVDLNNAYEISKYRQFLTNEYRITKEAFKTIHKSVASNYYSMNLDVAKAVMDKETTKAMDGLVVIDHYVKKPEELAQDVVYIAQLTGGKVVIGEMGVPIPDIHGKMSEEEQRRWLLDSMLLLSSLDELQGVNYWVNKDGSTALWKKDNTPKSAVEVITQYYGGKMD